VVLLGLSAGHKLGLALAAAGFAGFSLLVSMLLPRWWPQFPGRGLWFFLAVSFALFLGMLAAVEIFGAESESEAAGGRPVKVTEGPGYTIRLPRTTYAPGTYAFEVVNRGDVPHNLTVSGPGASEATSDIAPGKSASVAVELKRGSYDFYCSIPGHKALGMDVKVTVS
jgi:plastocyanin